MHRIDGSGHVGNVFTDGQPGNTEATLVTEDWLNAVQEELVAVVLAGGATLSKPDNTQLRTALYTLFGRLATANTWTAANATQAGLTATNSTTNGSAITATGNGTGAGLSATGGAGGPGARATGGTGGVGLIATGNGSAAGVVSTGGATAGPGGTFTGGGGNSRGLNATGTGNEAGLAAAGGATGPGVSAVGGATSGVGGTFSAQAGNSAGVSASGHGNGDGITAASSTGRGVRGTGFYGGDFTGTGGQGLLATGAAGAAGVLGTGGANAPGVEGAGNGTGAGVSGTGGTGGVGVSGTGGAASGAGGAFTATAGSSPGLTATGHSAGAGAELTGGSTGPGATVNAGTAATTLTPSTALKLGNGYLTFDSGVATPDSSADINRSLTPGNIIMGKVKFTVSGGGATLTKVSGFNVDTVAFSGGDALITWGADFPNADYCVAISCTSGVAAAVLVNQATGTTTVGFRNTSNVQVALNGASGDSTWTVICS